MCEAGNTVVMNKDGGYIQNDVTGERMRLRRERGTFVFHVKFNGKDEMDTLTLDSGA